MHTWVDADACPVVIKDILFRIAERTQHPLTLVANPFDGLLLRHRRRSIRHVSLGAATRRHHPARIHTEAVSAGELGFVHGVIGLAQQLLRVDITTLGKMAHADAARHLQAQAADTDRRGDRRKQALDERPTRGLVGEISEDGREFVTTEPRNRVDLAQSGAHPARDLHQELVTHLVTMRIVDRLEAIQVDVGERKKGVFATSAQHVLAQPVGQ